MPDPGREPAGRGERQLGNRGRRGHARADRSFRRVLLRHGPAEVGQDTVAHELGDMALESRDFRGDGALIGLDDLAHLLRVELGRQGRRADQIDEHHRELPALGPRPRGRLHRWRAQGRGGAQQALAVPERYAEGGEVGVGQVAHHVEPDVVVLKSPGVAGHSQALQPAVDIHPGFPLRRPTPSMSRILRYTGRKHLLE